MRDIQRSGKMLLEIISNILDLSKDWEAGKFDVGKSAVSSHVSAF